MTAMQRPRVWLNHLYEAGTLRLWLLCALPLWAVLVFTGYADPAPGYAVQGGNFALYIPVGALLVAFSLVMNWVKGFLVLHFGRISCGLIASGRMLARVHALMVLLEALATLCLFLLRKAAAYPVLEQLQLFGHELVYASLLGGYLRVVGEASVRRSLIIGLSCFLASSAWLLLSVIAAL